MSTVKYDMFSKLSLDELIQNEKAALSLLKSSSEYIASESEKDLWIVRRVMKVIHSYNWLTGRFKF